MSASTYWACVRADRCEVACDQGVRVARETLPGGLSAFEAAIVWLTARGCPKYVAERLVMVSIIRGDRAAEVVTSAEDEPRSGPLTRSTVRKKGA